jgi:hypothetical protein
LLSSKFGESMRIGNFVCRRSVVLIVARHLKDIQEVVIQRQTALCLGSYRRCPDCGNLRTGNGHHDLSVRTVFGYLKVKSARLHHCGCRPHESKTFSPLADLLPEHTTPELLFLETKWASLMSYGMTTQLMEDVLPMDEPLNAFTIRSHVLEATSKLGTNRIPRISTTKTCLLVVWCPV